MLSEVAVNRWRALGARLPAPRRTTGAGGQAAARLPGHSSARRAVPRLIRAAMAGAVGPPPRPPQAPAASAPTETTNPGNCPWEAEHQDHPASQGLCDQVT
jgi:hypothetical protein